jgi:hypothetical protein
MPLRAPLAVALSLVWASQINRMKNRMTTDENLFTALECVTDFPDDQIEDDRKIVQPGGRAVACAVSDLLKDAGMITTIPELDYEHGWEFDAAQDGRKYWLLVTDKGDNKMLIYTEDHSPLWQRWFGRNKASYVRFLNDLHRLLSQNERFRSVNWWSRGKLYATWLMCVCGALEGRK